jgi:hypothetical protein
MARRRLGPPLIPGFWIIMAFLLLLASVGGYYFMLASKTTFERKAVPADS